MCARTLRAFLAASTFVGAGLVVLAAGPAAAVTVSDEASLRAAWSDPNETQITLAADITLANCAGEPSRNSTIALTLTGNGHVIQQTCANQRVLEQEATGPVAFDGVTLAGGSTAGGGGGFGSDGPATLTNSTVRGNTASSGGGGIAATPTVTLTNSTMSDNSTSGDGGGVQSGTVRLTNSTVTGNTASGEGGGIFTGTATLVYATVVQNTAPTGANILASADTLVPFGSVVALPQGGGANCVVDMTTSNGFNFSDDTSCGFTNTAQGDRENAGDPGLAALASNGGPTQTRLPVSGSPLIDAIPAPSCQADGAGGITADQRGVIRPQGAGCDIGAVEVVPSAPPAPAPPAAVPVPAVVRFTG
jgi:predicted outer membrane repeat protein